MMIDDVARMQSKD